MTKRYSRDDILAALDLFDAQVETPPEPPPEIPASPAVPMWLRPTEQLNFRAGPGLKCAILRELAPVELVLKLGEAHCDEGKRWFRVRDTQGVVGWCHSGYLVTANAPAPAWRIPLGTQASVPWPVGVSLGVLGSTLA